MRRSSPTDSEAPEDRQSAYAKAEDELDDPRSLALPDWRPSPHWQTALRLPRTISASAGAVSCSSPPAPLGVSVWSPHLTGRACGQTHEGQDGATGASPRGDAFVARPATPGGRPGSAGTSVHRGRGVVASPLLCSGVPHAGTRPSPSSHPVPAVSRGGMASCRSRVDGGRRRLTAFGAPAPERRFSATRPPARRPSATGRACEHGLVPGDVHELPLSP